MQLSHRSTRTSELVGTAYKKFTVREDLELGQEKPPMDYIIRHSERVRTTDWKVTGGKIIVKGELEVFLEYQPREEGARQSVHYQIPVSQMMDVDGAGEECLCHVQLDLLWSALHPQTDADGLTRIASGEFTLGVRCIVLRENTILPAVDAYSTQYETAAVSKVRLFAAGGGPGATNLRFGTNHTDAGLFERTGGFLVRDRRSVRLGAGADPANQRKAALLYAGNRC